LPKIANFLYKILAKNQTNGMAHVSFSANRVPQTFAGQKTNSSLVFHKH
jgi:hypothetical protein